MPEDTALALEGRRETFRCSADLQDASKAGRQRHHPRTAETVVGVSVAASRTTRGGS